MAEARRLAQEAVKEDPEFALAYHQLALAAFWHEWKPIGTGAPGLKEVEAAEARADRLPEKERLTLRVFRALVDKRLVGRRRAFPRRPSRPTHSTRTSSCRPATSSSTGT